MSLNEQQIRQIVQDELRKIIDTGLMYTKQVPTKTINQQVEPKKETKQFTENQQLHEDAQKQILTLEWIKTQGVNGEYEKAIANLSNPEFCSLQDRIKSRGGLVVGDYFYWVFDKGETRVILEEK